MVEASWPNGALWWPPSRIAGRYLAPLLADDPPATRDVSRSRRAQHSRDGHVDPLELTLLLADHDAGAGDHTMALAALDAAELLAGTLPSRYLAKRAEWQQTLAGVAQGA